MRIGIDYSAGVNQAAGIGRFVRNLVQAVSEVDTHNEYVLMYATPNPGRVPSFPSAPNFATKQLAIRERLLTILWQRLQIPLSVERMLGHLDIFHAPDFVLPPVKNAVTLLTVHDLAFLIHPECAHEGLRKYLEHAVPRSIARADYILADSENTKSDVVCLMDADPDRVFVVPGAVDPVFVPAAEDAIVAARAAYQIRGPFILGVGTIEPRKNWPRLIEAYARFRTRTGLRHQLVIAGGAGWLTEETYACASRSAYADDIRFTGRVADAELVALYSGAEVFAYPSLYEGFGMPPLEAMACGTPVVCSNTSSLPECADGAALMVSPTDPEAISDAIERVCTDSDLRADLRLRGIARALEYGWEKSAQRLVSIYEQVGAAA
ncbi:MAG: glycosyltransferase family 1 protein [Chloroflexi bacterium]|nr:glycosyltransferase family 1 protein [Chloroflexota bacterium]